MVFPYCSLYVFEFSMEGLVIVTTSLYKYGYDVPGVSDNIGAG